jgi:hypothetical protein
VREHVLGDPLGFAAVSARKAWRLWGDYTVGTFRNRRPWITAYHLLLVAIGLAGLLVGLVGARGRRLEIAAPAIVVGYVTAVNLVLVSEARHNLPVMPVLVAGGLAGLVLAAQYRGIGLLPASRRIALRNRFTTSSS